MSRVQPFDDASLLMSAQALLAQFIVIFSYCCSQHLVLLRDSRIATGILHVDEELQCC